MKWALPNVPLWSIEAHDVDRMVRLEAQVNEPLRGISKRHNAT